MPVYKSCRWIEEGAFVYDKDVRMCCIRNLGNDTVKTIIALDDPKASAAQLLDSKNALRVANQTDDAPCKGCYLLKEQEWETKDHLGFVAMGGFLHCNLACSYCVTYKNDPRDKGSPILSTVKSWFEIGFIKPGTWIDIGGGEPMLHHEFEDIADFAFENGMKMTVFTNGVGISKSLLKGLREKLVTVIISVDAGTPETYHRIKGRNVLPRVWASLKEYAALQPWDVFAKYIVMDANRSRAELDAFLAAAQQAGVRRLQPSINHYQNVAAAGQLADPVLRALAYLHKKIGEFAHSSLADTISPQMQAEIVELAKRSDEDIMPSSLPNSRGALELAFSDSETFTSRAHTVIEARDECIVQFDQPVDVKEMPRIAAMIAELDCADGNYRLLTDSNNRVIGIELWF